MAKRTPVYKLVNTVRGIQQNAALRWPSPKHPPRVLQAPRQATVPPSAKQTGSSASRSGQSARCHRSPESCYYNGVRPLNTCPAVSGASRRPLCRGHSESEARAGRDLLQRKGVPGIPSRYCNRVRKDVKMRTPESVPPQLFSFLFAAILPMPLFFLFSSFSSSYIHC